MTGGLDVWGGVEGHAGATGWNPDPAQVTAYGAAIRSMAAKVLVNGQLPGLQDTAVRKRPAGIKPGPHTSKPAERARVA